MKITFTLLTVLFFQFVYAQQSLTVTGMVQTPEGKPLQKANVILYFPGEKDTLHTITNAKGEYSFAAKTKLTAISISYIGFKKFEDKFDHTNAMGSVTLPLIVMEPGDYTLETVTVSTSRVSIKEDTVSYAVDSTMYRKNDNVEQVIKNLPGVTVDKDGKITAQGKEVTKVKVNGKEFFGGDVKTATREINADMVDKIQVIDDYGDQSAFTGVKDGDPTKTLNIQLKKDKNKGYFGTATAGVGTKDRYLGSLSFNKFNGTQQISFTGNINNTNASTFNFSNLPGGMGAIASGMMRSFGGGTNFFGGNNDGVGVTKSLGLNYREEWSPKVSAYGSYSFSRKSSTVLSDIDQTLIQKNSSIFNKQHNGDLSVTDNHRFSFNIEYKIDSFNYVKFSPTVTYRRVADDYRSSVIYTDSTGAVNNTAYNTDINNSKAPNVSGNLLFNHRFHKKGRTLSVNLTSAKSSTDAEDDIYNVSTLYRNNSQFTFPVDQFTTQNNDNHNYGVSASFNEQLSRKRALEFNYAYNKRFTGNDRETFNEANGTRTLIDSLNNIYDNIYTTNRFGLNLRTTEKKYNYAIGFAVQPATIESNSQTLNKTSYVQHLVNYYPVVRFAYNFSRSRSFNLNYNGSSSQPTYQQLQPVYDYSNPQNIVIGNPDLRPEFTNTFSARYNNFDFVSGNVFFSNLSVSFVNDKIVNNIFSRYVTLPPVTPGGPVTEKYAGQETEYRNTNGYYNVNAFYNISKPFQNRKYVFNFGGNINYNNNISFLENEENHGRNIIASQRFTFDYKLKKWLETSAGVNFAINDARYSLTSYNNSSIKTWGLTQSSRMFFKNDFILSYDLDKQINSGYASVVDANPLIINGTLEKQFLKSKNLSLKLQAFDLLNQNTNVSRSVTGNSITDTRTNRLGRYFMLSTVFRLNKFAAGQRAGGQMQGQPVMRMMGM